MRDMIVLRKLIRNNLQNILSEALEISDDDIKKKTEVENFRHQLSIEFNVVLELYYTHPDSGPALKLPMIKVPEGMQRKGIGKQVMNKIIEYADKNGLRIFLTPSTDFGSSKSGLMRFYKSFGFILQSRKNRDYQFTDSMVRMPKSSLNEEVKLIAYHGTNKNFNSFDKSLIGTSNDPGDFGKGFYFDTEFIGANAYAHRELGTVIKAEINLNNPLFIDAKSYSMFNRKKTAREIDKNEQNTELMKYVNIFIASGVEFKFTPDTFLSVSRQLGAEKVTDILKANGYDGVIIKWNDNSNEVVAFDEHNVSILEKMKPK